MIIENNVNEFNIQEYAIEFARGHGLESIVDKICSDRASEITYRVLDKLENNTIKKYLNKQEEKIEKLKSQLDYLKFKSDLEDGLLDYKTNTDSALEFDNKQIKLLASQYILNNTLKDLNLINQYEEIVKSFKSGVIYIWIR
ncbi:hypothetical protein OD350_18125 [Clostridium beijerinckii]|uniref:hypothetical protein n=1 Tax=Clostridium beijerinckii TaxID=1520 RepID=UPI0022260539|nr:hypothetical protein [Clostridium beijerinckii]UYZ34162.1 hypothetical protein OD350_18125 [Clostridium beijerinckii]